MRAFSCAAALTLLLVGGPVGAEPSASDLATARRLFQDATALEQRSDWRGASAKLDAALAIKATPGLHFHRAHCAEQLGELVLAERHYGHAEELIRAGATAPDVEELLAAARARVLSRVPRLTLALPSDVTGVSVEIDGNPVSGPSGTPFLLDPGRHGIVARAPGHRDFETEIKLIEGQTQTLEVTFAREPAAVPVPVPIPARPANSNPESSGFGTREVVLVAEATVVVAGLGAGVGFSIARGSASNRIAQAQQRIDAGSDDASSGCRSADVQEACAELDDAMEDHEQASRFATIGFVTAGVGAAAAVFTWALWPSASAATNAGVAPVPGGATLLVRGAF